MTGRLAALVAASLAFWATGAREIAAQQMPAGAMSPASTAATAPGDAAGGQAARPGDTAATPAPSAPASAALPGKFGSEKSGSEKPGPARAEAARPLGSHAGPAPAAAAKAAAPLPEPVRLSADPRPAFGPDTFVATMSAVERHRAIVEAGGWPSVPNEATRLKPGDRDPAVGALRRRLVVSGDLPEAERVGDLFDEGLGAGLRRFQLRHGLEETGLVGPRSLQHLNVPAAQRLRQLQASAGRLIGSRFPFGDRYVAVNIPSAAVEAVSRGSVAHRYVAIVGKRDRPSPTVETRVVSVNFNPTWTVPISLVRKDIIPHVRKDPNYLARLRIRLFDAAGQEIDPGTLDWSTERPADYTMRQDSGVDNSLGEIRIDMPNRHSVYMHDTPSKRLFARSQRAQSSGCVRVSGVKELAAWLLEGAPGPAGPGSAWGAAEIDAAIASGRRQDARPAKAVPVAWVYLTGYATADGVAHFRDDVYGLDEPQPTASAGRPLTIEALVTSAMR